MLPPVPADEITAAVVSGDTCRSPAVIKVSVAVPIDENAVSRIVREIT